MVGISIFKTKSTLPELYGRIFFDGKQVKYQGVTCVFKKYVENGIKDLVNSYYLDHCPGTDPHHVDVHFLMVTIARFLYRMIERDLPAGLHNPDGSTKCLQTMRETLFRQGCARIRFTGQTMQIGFQNSFDLKQTSLLRHWFELLSERFVDGMDILGGFRLDYQLRPPYGEEHRNAYTKIPLNSAGTAC
jgi:hypothetical protein